MPARFKHVPVTHLYSDRPVVATVSVAGLRAGETAPPMPFSRLRRLLARGWVVFADPGKEQEAPVEPDPDPDVSEDETRDSDEPVPMSAREGNTGWWVVTYSDGSEKNMRWAAVEELGLTPEQE